jgi:hypothetical protein
VKKAQARKVKIEIGAMHDNVVYGWLEKSTIRNRKTINVEGKNKKLRDRRERDEQNGLPGTH